LRVLAEEKGFRIGANPMPIGSFIDSTCISASRPGGGPDSNDPTKRKNPLIQQAFYNGWKSIHGLKAQSVDLPNGMSYHVSDVDSARHNDLYTWGESNINELLSNAQLGNLVQ
jgi:hypothetical protein